MKNVDKTNQRIRNSVLDLHLQIKKENKKKKMKNVDDEMWFEDDPKAIRENNNDTERYVRKPIEVHFGVSEVASMASRGSNYYKYKRGSSSNGTRYTYKKGGDNG
tara:strand:+ start:582 stop:896 length:315 start_codon:yes stop_codon:yes gene_type:complete